MVIRPLEFLQKFEWFAPKGEIYAQDKASEKRKQFVSSGFEGYLPYPDIGENIAVKHPEVLLQEVLLRFYPLHFTHGLGYSTFLITGKNTGDMAVGNMVFTNRQDKKSPICIYMVVNII